MNLPETSLPRVDLVVRAAGYFDGELLSVVGLFVVAGGREIGVAPLSPQGAEVLAAKLCGVAAALREAIATPTRPSDVVR